MPVALKKRCSPKGRAARRLALKPRRRDALQLRRSRPRNVCLEPFTMLIRTECGKAGGSSSPRNSYSGLRPRTVRGPGCKAEVLRASALAGKHPESWWDTTIPGVPPGVSSPRPGFGVWAPGRSLGAGEVFAKSFSDAEVRTKRRPLEESLTGRAAQTWKLKSPGIGRET